jgi:hypothetical protein
MEDDILDKIKIAIVMRENLIFERFYDIPNMINSEGYILRLVLKKELEDAPIEHNLYIEATLEGGNNKVYCKINKETLKLYVFNRIKLKEVYLVRCDEGYYVFSNNQYTMDFYNNNFHQNVILKIIFGDNFYYEINKDMRTDPDDLIKLVSLFY